VWLLSAYCKHHSTETGLLYIHDHLHLIHAIGSQKVTCLCLLDLSAAFDIINHNILITHLSSRFGIHGSVLCWFKSYLSSYLSSRSFRVKCDNNLFSLHIHFFLWCSSRLCSRYSSLCTLPLSVLRPLLFPLTRAPPFIQMTLSLSQLWQAFRTFKTFFNGSLPGWLLIVLLLTPLRLISCSSDSKTYLVKYTTLYLTPLTLPEILASSLANIYMYILWPNNISPKPVTISHSSTSMYLALFRFLNCLPFTIATSTVHSKLYSFIFSTMNKSQLSCLQQIQNYLARTVVKAPKSCHITPILRSFHWLRTIDCIRYKFLSLTYKVLTTT